MYLPKYFNVKLYIWQSKLSLLASIVLTNKSKQLFSNFLTQRHTSPKWLRKRSNDGPKIQARLVKSSTQIQKAWPGFWAWLATTNNFLRPSQRFSIANIYKFRTNLYRNAKWRQEVSRKSMTACWAPRPKQPPRT